MASEDYAPGAIKRDPETRAVAIRTEMPDLPPFADRLWGVMTLSSGGHYCGYTTIEHWIDQVDVETPEVPAEPEGSEEE